MFSLFSEPNRRLFLLKTVAPIFVAALALNLLALALLLWATHEADRVAVERQHRLVELLISQLRSGVAHDQESVTVWDDALNAVQSGRSAKWIDANLGSWMHTYFGHDGAYVVNPQDNPIYAFAAGVAPHGSNYQTIKVSAAPLVAQLRKRLRVGDTEGLTDRVLTLGVADLSVVSGRPAIISVKPIVSDSGDIEQTPGEEYLHIAVRHLDESFITDLARDHLLDGLRFAWRDNSLNREASKALISSRGETIGYLIWEPYRPGAAVLAQVAPALSAVLVAVMATLGLLVAALRRRSLKLSLSEATVRHLAHHDLLTGLPTRGQFENRLGDALRTLRAGENLAVLYLDLDRFKEVNDTFGHPAGDELLREFADRLRRLTRETDTVARIAGDEFTIVLL